MSNFRASPEKEAPTLSQNLTGHGHTRTLCRKFTHHGFFFFGNEGGGKSVGVRRKLNEHLATRNYKRTPMCTIGSMIGCF